VWLRGTAVNCSGRFCNRPKLLVELDVTTVMWKMNVLYHNEITLLYLILQGCSGVSLLGKEFKKDLDSDRSIQSRSK
jgi:hypothetical protein